MLKYLFLDYMGQKKTLKHHQHVILREHRKQNRRSYWRELIKIELVTILSIAWFIQVELIRTKQVPSYLTYTQMQKFPVFQKEIANQASIVYNDMYRDHEFSKFILCDTRNDQLNGKIGFVDWYDSNKTEFHVLLCHDGSSSFDRGTPATAKTEHMESVKKVKLSEYNKKPKRDDCHVEINNSLINGTCKILQVRVRHDVLEHVCKLHSAPQRQNEQAYEIMSKMLEEKEEKQREEEASITKAREDYYRNMQVFLSSHRPVEARPRKKARTIAANTNTVLSIPVQSAWKAKFEHISNTFTNRQQQEGEHLFTVPFSTSDNSLRSCGNGLVELMGQNNEEACHDVVYSNNMKTSPIVITTESIKSLSPGESMDEDVFNFCLKW